jgi:hypothetical protein
MSPRSHHFQLPVATTVATVAFEVAAPGGGLFRVVGVVLVALSLMFTLHASERTSTRRNLSAAAIIVALLLGAYGSIVDDAEKDFLNVGNDPFGMGLGLNEGLNRLEF